MALLVAACGGSDGSESGGAASGEQVVKDSGCLSCHRIEADGTAEPGGDLTTVGARLSAPEIRRRLLEPPAGMPSYDRLSQRDLDAVASYLAGQR